MRTIGPIRTGWIGKLSAPSDIWLRLEGVSIPCSDECLFYCDVSVDLSIDPAPTEDIMMIVIGDVKLFFSS